MTMSLTGPLKAFNGCHLWLAVFDAHAQDSPDCQASDLTAAMLSTRDLGRWRRFRPLEKKRQFLNSRLAVRSVLREEFPHLSENVRLDSNAQGQPILVSADAEQLPQISLSHSGAAVAIAVSHGGFSVGVDIETSAPLRTDALRLMAANPNDSVWMCSPGKPGAGPAGAGPLNETEFLRTLWTIKESVWKSLGGSGQLSMRDISVDGQDGSIAARVHHPTFAGDIFRTKLFAARCEPIFPDTLLVDRSAAGMTTLRGSVSQWIPAGVGGSLGEFAGNSHPAIREYFP